jgi:hypothetical protein
VWLTLRRRRSKYRNTPLRVGNMVNFGGSQISAICGTEGVAAALSRRCRDM